MTEVIVQNRMARAFTFHPSQEGDAKKWQVGKGITIPGGGWASIDKESFTQALQGNLALQGYVDEGKLSVVDKGIEIEEGMRMKKSANPEPPEHLKDPAEKQNTNSEMVHKRTVEQAEAPAPKGGKRGPGRPAKAASN